MSAKLAAAQAELEEAKKVLAEHDDNITLLSSAMEACSIKFFLSNRLINSRTPYNFDQVKDSSANIAKVEPEDLLVYVTGDYLAKLSDTDSTKKIITEMRKCLERSLQRSNAKNETNVTIGQAIILLNEDPNILRTIHRDAFAVFKKEEDIERLIMAQEQQKTVGNVDSFLSKLKNEKQKPKKSDGRAGGG